jgi:hypothetical protein
MINTLLLTLALISAPFLHAELPITTPTPLSTSDKNPKKILLADEHEGVFPLDGSGKEKLKLGYPDVGQSAPQLNYQPKKSKHLWVYFLIGGVIALIILIKAPDNPPKSDNYLVPF